MRTIVYDVIEAGHGSNEAEIVRTVYFACSSRGLCRVSLSADSEEAFASELSLLYPDHEIIRRGDGAESPAQQGGELDRCGRAFREYLAGRLKAFEMPIDLSLLTPFQRRVLEATTEVGFSQTAGYGEIARRVGRPGASRAVGNALSKNPVPIVIPCHRVIASDGTLGGYRGGLQYKEALLALERS